MLPPGEYKLVDYECEEFAALVTLNSEQSSLHQQMFTLFELLDRLWDSNFAQYRLTRVSLADDDAYGGDTQSRNLYKKLEQET